MQAKNLYGTLTSVEQKQVGSETIFGFRLAIVIIKIVEIPHKMCELLLKPILWCHVSTPLEIGPRLSRFVDQHVIHWSTKSSMHVLFLIILDFAKCVSY